MKTVVVLSLSLFSVCTCNVEPRVVGGDFASIKQFPHSVFLDCVCDDGETICGASILNQNILLTAGHCMFNCKRKWSVNAFAGNEYIEKMPIMRRVTKYVIHSKYNPRTFYNDISLAYLLKELNLGPNVKRVIIPKKLSKVTILHVAGWGTVNEATDEQSIKLKSVQQTLQPKSLCKKVTRGRGDLCARNAVHQHPSRGDSGSALVTPKGEQIGLVSFRLPIMPELVVYTNISVYKKWITITARRLLCENKKK